METLNNYQVGGFIFGKDKNSISQYQANIDTYKAHLFFDTANNELLINGVSFSYSKEARNKDELIDKKIDDLIEAVKQDELVITRQFVNVDVSLNNLQGQINLIKQLSTEKKYPIKISANGDGQIVVNYGLVDVDRDSIQFNVGEEILAIRSLENDMEQEGVQYYAYIVEEVALIYVTQSEEGVYTNTSIYVDFGDGELSEMQIEELIVTKAKEDEPQQQILTYSEGDNQILYANTPIMNVFTYSDDTLISIDIPSSVTSIGEGAFSGCTGLTSVTIPNSVTTIGDSAFYGCSDLTSVTIPLSVTSIGLFAFAYCTGLTSVTIPLSVTTIGTGAFLSCTGLTSVTIPLSVTTIEEGAFTNCTGLTSVTIPNSVTSIGLFAFGQCIGLTSVTIPNSVTTIGTSAFVDCIGLTSVTYNGTVYTSKSVLTSALTSNGVTIDNTAFSNTGLSD